MRRENFFGINTAVCITVMMLCIGTVTLAQVDDLDDLDNLKYLDLGIKQFESANYEEADESFREVLGSVKVLPAEICYYFGANSYYLGKFKQSINWLNKYLELKGTSGQYFEECTQFLKLAQDKYLASTSPNKESVYDPGREIDYTVMPEIDCGPSGKVLCPVCKGQTVIIKRSALGLTYRNCPYCDTHGNLSCEEYNLLLQGKLKPANERTSE
jgi:tetratricopeptide (TPR) repeat protein